MIRTYTNILALHVPSNPNNLLLLDPVLNEKWAEHLILHIAATHGLQIDISFSEEG